MSSRVLLISVNRCTNPDPVFPLGLAFVAAALRNAGHDVRWYDVLASREPLEQVLKQFRPQYVGLSLRNIDDVLLRRQEVFFDQLQSLCRTIHDMSSCSVVLGGSGFSIFPQELLKFSGADYGICGPGEQAMVSFLAAKEQGREVRQIPGLVHREDGKIRVNPAAATAAQAAEVERPADLVSWYLSECATLNVQTQRGCAFHCCYCTYPLLEGRTHHRRSPELIAEDFAEAARLGAKYLFVVDSVFNSSHRHVQETCEAILRRNLNLRWGCFLRPQNLTRELMSLMARAGLAHVEFGTDSFCDQVLAAYHKGFTFEDVFRSSELAREQEIEFCHFLIYGGPGETRETILESYEKGSRLPKSVIMAMPGMRIYPGTALHAQALAEGRLNPVADLLNPTYYIAPGLDADGIFEMLRGFARRSPNWVVGDSSPAFTSMVARLRKRGVMGPLWSYASLIQRLWPAGFEEETKS